MLTWTDDFTTNHFADGTYTVSYVAHRGAGLQYGDWRDLRSALPPGWTKARIFADFGGDGPTYQHDWLATTGHTNLSAFIGFADADTAFPQVTSDNGWTGGIFTTTGGWFWEASYSDQADVPDGAYLTPARGNVPLGTFTVAVTVTNTGLMTIEASPDGSLTLVETMPPALIAALQARTNLCPVMHVSIDDSDPAGIISRWGYEITAPSSGDIEVGLATSAHCPVGP